MERKPDEEENGIVGTGGGVHSRQVEALLPSQWKRKGGIKR